MAAFSWKEGHCSSSVPILTCLGVFGQEGQGHLRIAYSCSTEELPHKIADMSGFLMMQQMMDKFPMDVARFLILLQVRLFCSF